MDFAGGEITSEAGLVLLREFDERLKLTASLKGLVADERDRRYIEHSTLNLLRQRIFQIAAGYEDANDATFLRHDPTLRVVVGRGELPLASQPTLSRLENAVPWESVRALERLGLEWFMRCGAQGRQSRQEIILDIDSTSDPTHGQQQTELLQRPLRHLHVPSAADLRGGVRNLARLHSASGRRRRYSRAFAAPAAAGDAVTPALAQAPHCA